METKEKTRFVLVVRFTSGLLKGLTGKIPTNFGHFKIGDKCNKPCGGDSYVIEEILAN